MKPNFWDLDGSGHLDAGEIFRIAFMLLCYVGGPILMFSTMMRSYHLLSSPQMMPGDSSWWPILTALTPELGLLTAWFATEVGFRKGRLELVLTGLVGVVSFIVVIATLQIYDVAMIQGQNISQAATWGHFIASVLPLITIVYLVICSALGAAMARANTIRSGSWQVQQPRYSAPRLPIISEDLGDPVADPLRERTNQHRQAQRIARTQIQSMGANGKDPKVSE